MDSFNNFDILRLYLEELSSVGFLNQLMSRDFIEEQAQKHNLSSSPSEHIFYINKKADAKPERTHLILTYLLYAGLIYETDAERVDKYVVYAITRKGRWFLEFAPSKLTAEYMVSSFPALLNLLQPGTAKGEWVEPTELSNIHKGYGLSDVKLTPIPKKIPEFSEKHENRQTMEHVDKLDGLAFEGYLSRLFDKLGYKSRKTKSSGDYGADILLEKDSTRIVVQAKNYKGKVGISAVQEIYSAKGLYDASEAWVVTNSKLTQAATNAAAKLGVRVVDRVVLANLIAQSEHGKEERISFDSPETIASESQAYLEESISVEYLAKRISKTRGIPPDKREAATNIVREIESNNKSNFRLVCDVNRLGMIDGDHSEEMYGTDRIRAQRMQLSEFERVLREADDAQIRGNLNHKPTVFKGRGTAEIAIPDSLIAVDEYLDLRISYEGKGYFNLLQKATDSVGPKQYSWMNELFGIGPFFADVAWEFPFSYIYTPPYHAEKAVLIESMLRVEAEGEWTISVSQWPYDNHFETISAGELYVSYNREFIKRWRTAIPSSAAPFSKRKCFRAHERCMTESAREEERERRRKEEESKALEEKKEAERKARNEKWKYELKRYNSDTDLFIERLRKAEEDIAKLKNRLFSKKKLERAEAQRQEMISEAEKRNAEFLAIAKSVGRSGADLLVIPSEGVDDHSNESRKQALKSAIWREEQRGARWW